MKLEVYSRSSWVPSWVGPVPASLSHDLFNRLRPLCRLFPSPASSANSDFMPAAPRHSLPSLRFRALSYSIHPPLPRGRGGQKRGCLWGPGDSQHLGEMAGWGGLPPGPPVCLYQVTDLWHDFFSRDTLLSTGPSSGSYRLSTHP